MEEDYEVEVNFSQGVLSIETTDGTWVINKQGPNQQIWWSSPMSGPLRFEFVGEGGGWASTRTGARLLELLREEMAKVYGDDLKWD
eukprot:CAMPEP_0172594104 /NCGR_PEP_ID=MMETSP1068-20121228/13420_1 /TAXON_ID=35684 /ORGANISM="Pseudopedinella elastica, Strain CCMP716" /LENGTH=85 /DNA_ID=CAMNT_0013391941 /DNA_START=221 /DNA_END=478 /DNA_ORIENTATION=+